MKRPDSEQYLYTDKGYDGKPALLITLSGQHIYTLYIFIIYNNNEIALLARLAGGPQKYLTHCLLGSERFR
jgi:hypothetical protein